MVSAIGIGQFFGATTPLGSAASLAIGNIDNGIEIVNELRSGEGSRGGATAVATGLGMAADAGVIGGTALAVAGLTAATGGVALLVGGAVWGGLALFDVNPGSKVKEWVDDGLSARWTGETDAEYEMRQQAEAGQYSYEQITAKVRAKGIVDGERLSEQEIEAQSLQIVAMMQADGDTITRGGKVMERVVLQGSTSAQIDADSPITDAQIIAAYKQEFNTDQPPTAEQLQQAKQNMLAEGLTLENPPTEVSPAEGAGESSVQRDTDTLVTDAQIIATYKEQTGTDQVPTPAQLLQIKENMMAEGLTLENPPEAAVPSSPPPIQETTWLDDLLAPIVAAFTGILSALGLGGNSSSEGNQVQIAGMPVSISDNDKGDPQALGRSSEAMNAVRPLAGAVEEGKGAKGEIPGRENRNKKEHDGR